MRKEQITGTTFVAMAQEQLVVRGRVTHDKDGGQTTTLMLHSIVAEGPNRGQICIAIHEGVMMVMGDHARYVTDYRYRVYEPNILQDTVEAIIPAWRNGTHCSQEAGVIWSYTEPIIIVEEVTMRILKPFCPALLVQYQLCNDKVRPGDPSSSPEAFGQQVLKDRLQSLIREQENQLEAYGHKMLF